MFKDIVDAPGRTTPLAIVEFAGKKFLHLPNEGIQIGQEISFADVKEGNIVELEKIPEGTKIYNIELEPGDGGKFCRSSGSASTLLSKEEGRCVIILPSGTKKVLSPRCRATIGSVAAGGRIEKPFRKAGNKFYAMRTLNRMWPRTKGVAMNPVNHPFGGKTKPGKVKTVSRNMPPGKKVGSISARRMGKKKRKA